MLTLRRTRCLLSLPVSSTCPSAAGLLLSAVSGVHRSLLTTLISSPAGGSESPPPRIHDDLVSSFRDWFSSPKKPLMIQIYEIISTLDNSTLDSSLSELNLFLTERLVLDVLSYARSNDVLACIKFFDWAGRQLGFHHTPTTFTAIFKILCKAQMTELMQEFLDKYRKRRYVGTVTFNHILVIGYSISGKCDVALEVLGRLRFRGGDINAMGYHVLLNGLVEQGFFEYAESFVKEIRIRGYENKVTHSIVVKSFSRQNQFEKAEEYVRSLLSRDGAANKYGHVVSTLISCLCKDGQYERAALLAEEIREMSVVSMEKLYNTWIGELTNAGKVDGALKFLKDKRAFEGYVPDVFRYNSLVYKLLRQNKFDLVRDLLEEMRDMGVSPDQSTWNAVLCFLCKVGRMDLAIELYHSSKEFGLSVSFMAYNYLINTLLGDGSADKLYVLLRNSVEKGYFPGERNFLSIADALCREGKSDKMKEFLLFVLGRNIMNNMTYERLINVLCESGRVDDAFWVYNQLYRLNKPVRACTYGNLISEFSKLCRLETAWRLVVEMQKRGLIPRLLWVRDLICCICKMYNPDKMIFKFLEMQLDIRHVPTSRSYLFFIDGAAHSIKPELARQLYTKMETSGVKPDWEHGLLLLISVLKSNSIAQAQHIFYDLLERPSKNKKKKQLWQIMIVGLCKANKADVAASMMRKMKSQSLRPSIHCYEELIKLYCDLGQFQEAVDLVNDMTQIPRPVSTFILNTFLMHSLKKSSKVYESWDEYARNKPGNLTNACSSLGRLAGVFSDREGTSDIEDIENMIRQCFAVDHSTINLLLRRAGLRGVDYVYGYFRRLCEKGFEPDSSSYHYIVSVLKGDGRMAEADKLNEEMQARKATT